MFYPECDRCAKNNSDLEPVITKIDKIFETLPQSSIILPEIIAQKISEKNSKASGVLEILCDEKLLIKKNYYECSNPNCENLIEIDNYEKAIKDGDSYECSRCQDNLTNKRLNEVIVFRFNPERYIRSDKLMRKKPTISPTDFNEEEQISVLFLSADPSEQSRLRTNQEYREIQEKLTLAKKRDWFYLEQPQLSARPEDVSQALLNFQPTIVHFSGHGASDGALCFENRSGETQFVDPDALTELFKQFIPRLVCVILNACYSEIQAKAIAKHVNYVIGMNSTIADKAAIAYSIGFYQALGAGCSVEQAHTLGCVQIRLQGIPDYLIPVLFKKQ